MTVLVTDITILRIMVEIGNLGPRLQQLCEFIIQHKEYFRVSRTEQVSDYLIELLGNPELKSLIREIDDITDMSDMKVAKKAGKIIKAALD